MIFGAPMCGAKRRKLSTDISTPDLARAFDTDEVLQSLVTKTNSDGVLPLLARAHNGHFQARRPPHAPHLLALPPVARQKIWQLVLRRPERIVVSARNTQQCAEPALLLTCRDIRSEALPIFYRENSFELQVYTFDVMVLQPWCEKYDCIMGFVLAKTDQLEEEADTYYNLNTAGTMSSLQKNMVVYTIAYVKNMGIGGSHTGNCSWSAEYSPDWDNLVGWLKLYHEGHINAYHIQDHASRAETALLAVFDMVRDFRKQSWNTVEMMLPGLRKLLYAADRRWGVDSSGPETPSDMDSERESDA
ncbi:hypothetical protein LTR37_001423 [Vermiconidia calcicola]|uniref:Uncharacterized protein n=1 Tax=Vermiconidia calcicola TaxID=1690605 RepID=A0ACC3NX10_9PEZI|nr:hypothetical protein LTR37_001423 [Vermiconidia calcicola]